MTLIVWTNLTLSAEGQVTANTVMLKVLDQIYVESPLKSSSKVHTLNCSTASTANPAIILPAPSQCRRGRRSIRQNGTADHTLREGRSR